ncbi:MAG: plasmid mobilization relaxosome protein MobC [Mucilaginibacter sp.]
MGRRKASHPDENLTEVIMLRVSGKTYKKLDDIRANSDCQTVPEVVRRIIEKEQIIYYHKDASMDAPMEVMIRIQKELKAIGININQVTRYFNGSKTEGQRWHYIQEILNHYKQVDARVTLLLSVVTRLAKKWLQK